MLNKALRESPIGREDKVAEQVKLANQKQCLQIGGDLCSLIGMTMIDDGQEKGKWLGEKLTPIINQLQRGAGITFEEKKK